MHQVASAGWHLVAIGCTVFVACSTALPTGTNIWFFVFDVEKLITRGSSVIWSSPADRSEG
jgi:hypothetical protein